MDARDDDAGAAIARLTALRAEHKPILEAIVTDAGMAPATRALLVAHLTEEEDEHIAEVGAAISAGGSAASAHATPTDGLRDETTTKVVRGRVVPRRGDDGRAAGGGLSVGSLRPARATAHAWRRER